MNKNEKKQAQDLLLQLNNIALQMSSQGDTSNMVAYAEHNLLLHKLGKLCDCDVTFPDEARF